MVTTFAIGSYLSMFGASAIWSVENHYWVLQKGQVAVGLIVPVSGTGTAPGSGTIEPAPISNSDAVAASLESSVDLTEARVLSGVQGPFYGYPVDDNEGYSGRMRIAFPESGLPHPELAVNGICATESLPLEGTTDNELAQGELAPWRCAEGDQGPNFELNPYRSTIWAGNMDDLRLMLGGTVDSATSAAFARGDALVFDARYLAGNDTVTIAWHGEEFVPENEPGEFLPAGPPLRSERVPAQLVPLEHALDYGVFLNQDVAERLGLDAQPSRLLGELGATPTDDERYAASEAVAAAAPEATWLDVEFEFGPPKPDYAWSWGALAIAFGITLAITMVAVGLARIEGRGTERTLESLGADPGIRRRMSAWYALIVVGFSTVTGTVLGILPTYAMTINRPGFSAPQLPWLELGLLAIGVPLVATLVAWLAPVRRNPSVLKTKEIVQE